MDRMRLKAGNDGPGRLPGPYPGPISIKGPLGESGRYIPVILLWNGWLRRWLLQKRVFQRDYSVTELFRAPWRPSHMFGRTPGAWHSNGIEVVS